MTTEINPYFEDVERLLYHDRDTTNPYPLIVAAERMHRCRNLKPDHLNVQHLFGRYELLLRDYQLPKWEDIETALAADVAELQHFGATPPNKRDRAHGIGLLWSIDDTICVAIGLWRMGKVSSAHLYKLRLKIQIPEGLNELANEAENTSLIYCDENTQLVPFFDWWEDIAQLDPKRHLLEDVVRAEAHKQRLIAQAIKNFEKRVNSKRLRDQT